MRILHIAFKMGRGGFETWLMNILRRIDRRRYQMDFLVQTEQKCSYDDEILSLGSKIIRIRPETIRPQYFLFLRDFRNILQNYGLYQVVHAHNTVRHGILLREAAKAGTPVRIMHSHSLQMHDRRLTTLPFCSLGRYWMHKYATAGLGCSRDACTAMFGKNWSSDPRYRPLYYGIDLAPYRDRKKDCFQVRNELNIPSKSMVVGHVGRFFKIKNHDYIVDIAGEMIRQNSNVRFLLVGDGPERAEIEQRVGQMRLTDYFVFAGERADVARMLSAMDVFVLPSFSEGLGIVLLEAQAMGLPCLMTHNLPSDVDIVKELCHRLPLADGPRVWSEKLLSLAGNCPMNPSVAFETIEKSPFNIEVSVRELVKVYEERLNQNDGIFQ